MRILIDQAVYDLRNKGNVALLQVAVARLRALWPQAVIGVLTVAPNVLRYYCPEVIPVPLDAAGFPDGPSPAAGRRWAAASRFLLRWMLEAREALHSWRRQREPRPAAGAEPGQSAAPSLEAQMPAAALLASIDLLVASGGGYMCDSDQARAAHVLRRLEAAQRLGRPTAMVGQGVGPLESPALREQVRAVVPGVGCIFVRERRQAIPLLTALDVPADRIVMAGDDAVELAYQARGARLGRALGVSLRLAHYTQVDREQVTAVRAAVQQVASARRAPLLAVPISEDLGESDARVIDLLLAGYPAAEPSRWRFDTPAALIRRVGRCRVVVAGAFHAAVFALGQGIPVVGLVRSSEYALKFEGLRAEFGSACQVLALDDPRLPERLAAALHSAWDTAEAARPELLAAAEHQIALNQAAYRRLPACVAG